MRIFLTGSTGILGSDIRNVFEANNHELLGFSSSTIRLHNLAEIQRMVDDFKPDLICHCAAMTAVDKCETERKLAYQVNVKGTENLAIAAKKIDAKMVYISSCGVYGNGKAEPYHESDEVHPVNYHHFTKLEGERKVKQIHSRYLIIRPGWLFGGTQDHQKNFIEARRKEAMGKPVLQSAFDKAGSPTYTKDVAKQLLYLVEKNLLGTFNVVNEGEATRFSYVNEIVRLLNLPVKVEPVNSALFPRPAQMPDNEALENRNLNLKNCNMMSDWRTALKSYIKETYE